MKEIDLELKTLYRTL